MNILVKILEFKLKELAKLTIWRYRPKVIAITGSAGKTSTKEAVFAVLNHSADSSGRKRRVRKSTGNLNNELGVPLTIISDSSEEELKLVSRSQPAGEKKLQKTIFWFKTILLAFGRILIKRRSVYPNVLVLEYGADRPGDIKRLTEIAKPRIGIVTAIGEVPVHVEFFSSPETVVREKSKLIENLSVNDFAVLNFDNDIVMKMRERTRGRIVTFGFNEGADVRVTSFENRLDNDKPIGISFKIEYSGSFIPVIIYGVLGRAHAYAAAAAACVGLIFDLNLVEISEAISKDYKPVKGRMNLVDGIKETCIIDDTYNASPLSVSEAINTLKDLPGRRKVAVLGDMLELGEYSVEEHQKVGKMVAGIADMLITVGSRGKFIAESAGKAGLDKNKILSFDTAIEAGKEVQNLIKPGDLILIKASRGIGLDKIVEEIEKVA